MDQTKKPSPRHPRQSNFELTCSDCGTKFIGQPGLPCPRCQGHHAKRGDELTKKITSDSDLFK